MFARTTKNIAIASVGLAFNSYCMFHAVQANNKWNKYLASLSPEEHEKLCARDWYLSKHGAFYGTGIVQGERYDIDMYKAKPEKEKELILTRYRWDVLRKAQAQKLSR
ncbi:MAG: hypothetical protein KBD83_02470 [Gammaproteobacteria bacterium]|nr:hypothetical protein [Gammaproteobacteria bacterium]